MDFPLATAAATATATASTPFDAAPSTRRQTRALALLSATQIARARILHLCCVAGCPVLAVALAGVVCLTLGNLIRDAPESTTLFCSPEQPLLSDTGVPLQFDTLHPPRLDDVNHAAFYKLYAATSFAKKFSCAYAFDDAYAEMPPYFPTAANSSDAQLDTTYLPKPRGGWLAYKPDELSRSLSSGLKPLYPQLPQTYPWYLYDAGGQDLGARPRAPDLVPAPAPPKGATNTTTTPANTTVPAPAPAPAPISASSSSGPLGAIPSRVVRSTDGQRFLPYPYFTPLQDPSDLATAFETTLRDIARTTLLNDSFPYPPHGTIHFRQYDPLNNKLSLLLQIGTSQRIASDLRLATLYPSQGIRQIIAYTGLVAAMLASKPSSQLHISHTVQALPRLINPVHEVDVTGVVGASFYPLALSFLLPLFVMKLVKEKEDKLYMMMTMHGLQQRVYFFVNYVYFFGAQFIAVLFFVATGLAFKMTLFYRTNPTIYVLLLLLWCHANASFPFFITHFFDRSRRAVVVMFLVMLMSVLFHLASDAFFVHGTVSFIWLLYPPFAFYYCLRAMAVRASYINNIDPIYWSNMPSQFVAALCILAAWGMLFLALGWLLWNRTFNVYNQAQQSPLAKLWRRLRARGDATMVEAEGSDDGVEHTDEVARDKRAAMSHSAAAIDAVCIERLSKRYPRGNLAINKVSLRLQAGTVFGLLGPNGAGKTTLFRMLTGLIQPTSGEAYICGKSITRQISDVHQYVGVCSQDDVHWVDLTVYEHILFYCRLRGVSKSDEAAAAQQALDAVQLTYASDTMSQYLSGGERRRLSIGIALAGTTRVVFLDEPTTGVDPEAKRKIWSIIQGIREHVTVMLTTHSMDEAEMLCTKIGILANGQFKCVGTLEELRQRHTNGYQLSVLLEQESDDVVREVAGLLPAHARIVERHPGLVVFQLAATDRVSGIFAQLGHVAGLRDYAISQMSLEDIFVRTTGAEREML